MSLLAVVPAFSECFPETSAAVLRFKGTDPRTGKFWSGIPTILVLVYSLPITTHLRIVDVYGKLQVLIENVVLEFDRLVSSMSDFYFITSVHMKRLNDSRLVDLSCLMMMCSFKNRVQVQLYLFSNFDINTLDHTKMNIALHHASEDGVVFPVRRLNAYGRISTSWQRAQREDGEFALSCNRCGPRCPHSEKVVSQSFKVECPSRKDTTSI